MVHCRETQNSSGTTIVLFSFLIVSTTTFIVWMSTTTCNNNIQKKDTDNDLTIGYSNKDNSKGDELEFWKKQRQEERAGRIRAEVKLRQAMKEIKQLQMDALVAQQHNNNGSKIKNDTKDSNIEFANSFYSSEHEKNQEDRNSNNSVEKRSHTRTPTTNHKKTMLLLESIGYVVSPFTKRMGTPRQPQLVPDSRGYIQMTCPRECLDGISDYSHLWIVFEFHANTNIMNISNNNSTPSVSTQNQTTSNKQQQKQYTQNQQQRTKIRPPRSPIKVGQLATRTPHRINPIGLSLVSIAKWDPKNRQLHITGLDLVNGTPVYDIKPCVPWDIPGYYINNRNHQHQQFSSNEVINQYALSISEQPTELSLSTTTLPLSLFGLKVPVWVIQEDEISNVSFTNNALQQLQDCLITKQLLAPFYSNKDDYETCIRSIQQILAQDPRSSHKGLKINARGTSSKPQTSSKTPTITKPATQPQSSILSGTVVDSTIRENTTMNKVMETNNDNNNNIDDLHHHDSSDDEYCYNIIFGQVRISFIVLDDGAIQVRKIEPIEFDPTSYVDGVPLILLLEQQQQKDNTQDDES